MIVLLDTSTGLCRLTLMVDDQRHEYEWQADRLLARGLLEFVERSLAEHGMTFDDITALGVFRGPGSYTGLRIGITVWNTIADARNLPIVGEVGSVWQAEALKRLLAGGNDRLILPEYGGQANITTPRK